MHALVPTKDITLGIFTTLLVWDILCQVWHISLCIRDIYKQKVEWFGRQRHNQHDKCTLDVKSCSWRMWHIVTNMLVKELAIDATFCPRWMEDMLLEELEKEITSLCDMYKIWQKYQSYDIVVIGVSVSTYI